MNLKIAVAINIDPFNAVPAKHVVTNRINRVFRIQKLLQANAQLRVILFGDEALKDTVLHRGTISFEKLMDFCPAPVVFDIVGHKNELHDTNPLIIQTCSSFFLAGPIWYSSLSSLRLNPSCSTAFSKTSFAVEKKSLASAFRYRAAMRQ